MKYANDPFWVRLRLFLFVLFWVVWIAMLVGAIVIVAFAPGCPATASLPWWKKSAMMELSVGNADDHSPEALTKCASNINDLTGQLPQLNEANFNTIVISGLDPYLLAEERDNDTASAVNKARDALQKLIEKAHSDDSKTKVVLRMNLADTSVNSDMFVKSAEKQPGFENQYIWADKEPQDAEVRLQYQFNQKRNQVFASPKPGRALLNFGDESTVEKVKKAVLSWVRFKVDGIQSEGDFYSQDATSKKPSLSAHVAHQVHQAVKTGGKNKAFLVANSKLESEDVDLSPKNDLWNRLLQAADVKAELEQIFKEISTTNNALDDNATALDPITFKEGVGLNWNAQAVESAMNENNQIRNKLGQSIAEGILAAFHLMPKTSPVVQMQLPLAEQKLGENSFVAKLTELRNRESETFLLGKVYVLHTNSTTSAIYRSFRENNGYLLLINFGDSPQSVHLARLGIADTSHILSKRVVLADSQSPAGLVGSPVTDNVSLSPKQVLIVEFDKESD